MNTNTSTESAINTRLEALTLETKVAKELREMLLVLRTASISEAEMCSFVNRYINGRKIYEN